jgi:hypothetical protein
MKGIVFTEFLDMVAQRYSLDMVDAILDDACPASGGAYTAVGTYPHQEMVALVQALAPRAQLSPAQLLQAFGEHLFGRFVQIYPAFFVSLNDALIFLCGIEDIIHAEAHKLYPDAELPRFLIEEQQPGRLVLRYLSSRHLEDLAEGLIRGCASHFQQTLQIERQACSDEHGQTERFILTSLADVTTA